MKPVALVIALIVLLGGGFLLLGNKNSGTSTPSMKPETNGQDTQRQFTFQNPKKSAHYESNTPAHGSTLAGVPVNVIINFNFDLAKPSEIKILMAGDDYGIGETIIN